MALAYPSQKPTHDRRLLRMHLRAYVKASALQLVQSPDLLFVAREILMVSSVVTSMEKHPSQMKEMDFWSVAARQHHRTHRYPHPPLLLRYFLRFLQPHFAHLRRLYHSHHPQDLLLLSRRTHRPFAWRLLPIPTPLFPIRRYRQSHAILQSRQLSRAQRRRRLSLAHVSDGGVEHRSPMLVFREILEVQARLRGR